MNVTAAAGAIVLGLISDTSRGLTPVKQLKNDVIEHEDAKRCPERS